jgi:hypothetical protein
MLENHSCALVEHLTHNNKIEGSKPDRSTKRERKKNGKKICWKKHYSV